MDPIEAGHKGSKEIYFAILSTTITLAAVFLPIIFLQGLTGRLFREFGIVVAGAVLISALVSLTLTPMMSSRMLRKQKKHSKIFSLTEKWIYDMIEVYNRSLKMFIRKRWIAMLIILVSILIIAGIGYFLPSELAPLEDKSRLSAVVTAPEGTSFELMDQYMLQLLQIADTIPERSALLVVTAPGFGSSSSVNSGFLRVILTEPSERDRSQQQIADELGKNISSV